MEALTLHDRPASPAFTRRPCLRRLPATLSPANTHPSAGQHNGHLRPRSGEAHGQQHVQVGATFHGAHPVLPKPPREDFIVDVLFGSHAPLPATHRCSPSRISLEAEQSPPLVQLLAPEPRPGPHEWRGQARATARRRVERSAARPVRGSRLRPPGGSSVLVCTQVLV